MGIFSGWFGKKQTSSTTTMDPLLEALQAAYPAGPFRRGVIGDAHAANAAIAEILIFAGDDHWLQVFVGAVDLVVRVPKSASPPTWPVEPVTRIADAVVAGAEIGEGTTWIIGKVLSPFAGFITLPAPGLSTTTAPVWQLVPVTAAELAGTDTRALLETVRAAPGRLTATVST